MKNERQTKNKEQYFLGKLTNLLICTDLKLAAKFIKFSLLGGNNAAA